MSECSKEALLNHLVSAFIEKHHIKTQNIMILDCIRKSKKNKSLISLNSDYSFTSIQREFESLVNDENRTKHGVVYTPDSIVDYIVNKTVDKNSMSICDPSCGTGVFLVNAAKRLHDLTGKPISEIIEQNIYGADILEEHIKYCKILLILLMLSTGDDKKDLSFNLRTYNSLTFDWKKQYPVGFDIIIGNPPYISQKGTTNNPNIEYADREYFKKTYQSLSKSNLKTRGGVKLNLFALWIEKSIELLSPGGTLGLIVHKNILKVESYKFLRKFILDNTAIIEIFDLGPGIFKNVVGETVLLNIKKIKMKTNTIIIKKNIDLEKNEFDTSSVPQALFYETNDHLFNIYQTPKFLRLKEKMWTGSEPLYKNYNIISYGLNTKDNKKYFLSVRKEPSWKKAVKGRNIAKWSPKSFGYVCYDDKVLDRTGDVEAFESSEKLILQRISSSLIATYDDDKLYCYNSTNMILPINKEFNIKYLLCLLNSNLINYYYITEFSLKAVLTVNITQGYLSQIPIKTISLLKQQSFIEIADEIINLTNNFYSKRDKFIKIIHTMIKIPTELPEIFDKFYELQFDKFFKVIIKKSSNGLSGSTRVEFLEFFEKYKEIILDIKNKIHNNESEMNKLVYELYGISKEEIERIEES